MWDIVTLNMLLVVLIVTLAHTARLPSILQLISAYTSVAELSTMKMSNFA